MINNYIKLNNGIIKQQKFFDKKRTYNIDYIKNSYDTYDILSKNMSYLRLGYLLGSCKEDINSILDVGYGNGDFLKVASDIISNCYGFEVNAYPIPKKCLIVDDIYKDHYDVVCFFDVLEHFEDIYEIQKLNTKYIYISVPECHYFSDEWFSEWKHRRPDEHLWHFNKDSLNNFMEEIGFINICYSNIEDAIRKNGFSYSNILNGLFKKK